MSRKAPGGGEKDDILYRHPDAERQPNTRTEMQAEAQLHRLGLKRNGHTGTVAQAIEPTCWSRGAEFLLWLRDVLISNPKRGHTLINLAERGIGGVPASYGGARFDPRHLRFRAGKDTGVKWGEELLPAIVNSPDLDGSLHEAASYVQMQTGNPTPHAQNLTGAGGGRQAHLHSHPRGVATSFARERHRGGLTRSSPFRPETWTRSAPQPGRWARACHSPPLSPHRQWPSVVLLTWGGVARAPPGRTDFLPVLRREWLLCRAPPLRAGLAKASLSPSPPQRWPSSPQRCHHEEEELEARGNQSEAREGGNCLATGLN